MEKLGFSFQSYDIPSFVSVEPLDIGTLARIVRPDGVTPGDSEIVDWFKMGLIWFNNATFLIMV